MAYEDDPPDIQPDPYGISVAGGDSGGGRSALGFLGIQPDPYGDPASTDPAVVSTGGSSGGGKGAAKAPSAEIPPADPVSSFLSTLRGVGEGAAKIEEQRGAQMERTESGYTALLNRDRAQMEKARSATAASMDAMPPKWDADQERAKRIQDPIATFGSIGSIFAMAASTFTRTPMTSALNASAAAMQAIRASDEKGYESAYQAWKDNTNLALQRFNMEKTLFDQSSHLMTSDMGMWRQQMLLDAAKFDNKKAVFMLQNGMDKELIQSVESMVKARDGIVKAQKDMYEFEYERMTYRDGMKAWKEENPGATPQEEVRYSLQLLHDIKSAQRGLYNRPMNAEQAAVQAIRDDPNLTTEEKNAKLDAIIEAKRRGTGGQVGVSLENYRQDVRREHPDWSVGQVEDEAQRRLAKAKQAPAREGSPTKSIEIKKGELRGQHPDWSEAQIDEEARRAVVAASRPKPVATLPRLQAAAIEKKAAQLTEQGEKDPIKALSDATRDVMLSTQILSGNRRDDLASLITRAGVLDETIDKVEQLLVQHNALTGLGGRITRPGEVVGNWFGNNKTDRAQFKTYIQELRELAPRLLQESRSRPLSSEEQKIKDIVPGLDAGDTTANTADRLLELRGLIRQQRKQLEKRYQGTWSPEGAPGGAKPAGGNWWDRPDAGAPAQ